MKIKHIIDSYKGIDREKNNDGTFFLKVNGVRYYAIFDGVGISIGAKEAVCYSIEFLENNIIENTNLVDLVYLLNSSLLASGIDEPYTTICMVKLYDNNADIISIGDSRCYFVHDSYYEKLTVDDSFEKNHLSKCLGKDLRADDIKLTTYIYNSDLLLCTDGFYNLMERLPTEIHHMLKKHSKASIKKTITVANSDDASYIYIYSRAK